jgi:uncharacterized protein YciW
MDEPANEAAPFNVLDDELEALRETLRRTVEHYRERLDAEILAVQARVGQEAARKKLSSSRVRDLRDMLTVLRNVSVNPDKARRKDLKRLDAVISDLTILTENWR